MLQLFRTNPGLLISLILLAGGTLVSLLAAFLMARAGASIRPAGWFAGFFALILLPQVVGHFYLALRASRADTARSAALDQVTRAESAPGSPRSEGARSLFGPDVDPQLITDARNILGGAFRSATLAQFAILPDGDTVVIARFNSSEAAEKAWIDYLRTSGLNQLNGKGDSQRGYLATRPVGDRAYAVHMDTLVGVWTGATDEAIQRRMTLGGFRIPRGAPLTGSTATLPADETRSLNGLKGVMLGAGAVVYLLIVVLYFFKGAAWAGTYTADAGVPRVPRTELGARLENLNTLDVPFRIERGPGPNEYLATWRYADARWLDLARARGIKRTFRIRITLDEQARTVRATDEVAQRDWSAGAAGAAAEWRSSLGIVLFHHEQVRVVGVGFDSSGRMQPEAGHAYRFNLDELKTPLVALVTRSGWNWRPTVWQGPAGLRWLTE